MTREEAIKWLEEEKASFERAPDLNGCPMTECWQKAIDVYDMAISALRQQEQPPNAPLTMAELRTMDGEVWVCYPQSIFGSNLPPAEDMSCSRYKFKFSDYGKTWLAYRRKPEDGTV